MSYQSQKNPGGANVRCASSIQYFDGYVGLRTFNRSHSTVDRKMQRFWAGPKFEMVLKHTKYHVGAELFSLGQAAGDAAVKSVEEDSMRENQMTAS